MFAGPQLLFLPANRPFGLFGHGHRMLTRQQALRCLRGRNSFESLLTGPSVFPGTGITCFVGSQPFRVLGDATRLRPCKQALHTFQGRKSHASLAAGPAIFSEQHHGYSCVWAAEMRLGFENALSMQIGVWAENLQSAANWRLGCNWGSGCNMAFEFVRE